MKTRVNLIAAILMLVLALPAWAFQANGGGGGGGGGGVTSLTCSTGLSCSAATGAVTVTNTASGFTLTADETIPANTAVSVNAAGHAVAHWGPAPDIANTATLFSGPQSNVLPVSTPSGSSQPSILALSSTQFVAFATGTGVKAFSLSGDVITVGPLNNDDNLRFPMSLARLDATHFIFEYSDFNTSELSLAVVSVASNVLTIGTPVVVDANGSSPGQNMRHDLAALDATSFLLTYKATGGTPTYVVGTISGTTITLGAPSTTNFPAGAINFFPLAMSASQAVILWSISSGDIMVADVGAVSGTTLTLSGTPSALATPTSGDYPMSAAKVDATHFAVGVNTNVAAQQGQWAAAASISGGVATFGAAVFVNAGWWTFPVFITVLDATHIAFYYNQNAPTICTLSGTTLTISASPALPIQLPSVGTSVPPIGSTPWVENSFWPPVVSVGANLFFTDGDWNIYAENNVGTLSPNIQHLGIVGYAFAPISSTKALALIVDGQSNVLARVLNFSALNASAPVGVTAAGAASSATVTIQNAGKLTGLSGLTPGVTYYSNGDGSLVTVNTGHAMGTALSATELAVAPH
jgi:hypothetical protein